MQVRFTVTADMAGVPAKVESVCSDTGLGMFAASEAERLMQPFVPERDSILIASTTRAPFEVTYNTPYARYQYYGVGIKKRTKTGSRSHWEKGINVPDLANAISAYIKGRM